MNRLKGGVAVSLKPFDFARLDLDDYYFIAHLFSRVLIGDKYSPSHEQLVKAIENDEVLEVHFFNPQKEICASRIEDTLMLYEPLEHVEPEDEENVILRSYKLEKKFMCETGYNTLEVKEYIKFDENDHLAYTDRTVLYRLTKKGEKQSE